MQIFKFGGASVKDSKSVKNLADILKSLTEKKVVVVSAMGKITRDMEALTQKYFLDVEEKWEIFDKIVNFHKEIIFDLFDKGDDIHQKMGRLFFKLRNELKKEVSLYYDYKYDQIVSYGELFSTTIVSEYLLRAGIDNHWVDIREAIKSDCNYREARIDWKLSEEKTKKIFHFQNTQLYVTQGFIAGSTRNTTTTLGKEGSDYTAAILGNILDVRKVVIWKDVPGILSADPQFFESYEKIDAISYREAVELSFSGAKIIHPKTIKPLENKRIPLYVNSFINFRETGTIVRKLETQPSLPPIVVLKKNQILFSLSPKDFSFVVEDCLSKIFKIFNKFNIKPNLMQHSALNFSISINRPCSGLEKILKELNKDFEVKYNDELELLSIRHYNTERISQLTANRKIYLEQKTRNTARFLLKN